MPNNLLPFGKLHTMITRHFPTNLPEAHVLKTINATTHVWELAHAAANHVTWPGNRDQLTGPLANNLCQEAVHPWWISGGSCRDILPALNSSCIGPVLSVRLEEIASPATVRVALHVLKLCLNFDRYPTKKRMEEMISREGVGGWVRVQVPGWAVGGWVGARGESGLGRGEKAG